MARNQHQKVVAAWASRVGSPTDAVAFIRLHQTALTAVWNRANVTISEVTLAIVADRAVFTSQEKFPWISVLKAEESGINLDVLFESSVDRAELGKGLQCLITEFLTVMGGITEEIITPALHKALSAANKPELEKNEGTNE
jgi:hypothetical protein